MKKLIAILSVIFAIGTANSAPVSNGAVYTPTQINQAYSNGYNAGYHSGKSDGRTEVAKVVFIAGVVVIAGAIIYNASKESRWATNEKGVVYRF